MRSKINKTPPRIINPYLEAASLLLSLLAFTLAIFLLSGALLGDVVCLPMGCYPKGRYPVFYWLALAVYVAFIPLMAYVFMCGIRTVNRAVQRRLKADVRADELG